MVLLGAVLLLSLSACAASDGYREISFNFDGENVPLENKCLLMESTTMIPMREIFTMLGMTIEWDESTSTATGKSEFATVEVADGSNILRLNGAESLMPANAVVYNDRMYVPLRVLAESLGMEVDYSEKLSTAYVFSQKREVLSVPQISVTTTALSDEDKAWLTSTLDGAVKKVAKTVGRTKDNVCYSTRYGLFSNKGAEKVNWWTNGFYPGILWMMYENTHDWRYAQYAQNLENQLAAGLADKATIDHDMGFLWMNSGYRNYLLTKNEASKQNVLKAADELYARYNREGRFIVAWNGKGNENKSIIDTMMNLDLMYTATNLTRNPVYANAASKHADTTMRTFVRADGSCHHQVVMDPKTGDMTGFFAGQGYDDGTNTGSHWARGNAWALYGFAKCFGFTGNIQYLETSKKVADYFRSGFRNGYEVPMDFKQPKYISLVDTSAAAIAASGYIDLARHTDDPTYLSTAVSLLKKLTEKYGGNNGEEALLTHGCVTYSNPVQQTLIYGDFYYLEALMKLRDFAY